MAAVTSPETSPQPRVYFQTPAGTAEEPETPVRKQGRVTVKYDRKELRKRLNLEEWIIEQLTDLYDCEEEAIPELEIDVDELLDMPSDVERAARVKDLLVDCFKPTECVVSGVGLHLGAPGQDPRDAEAFHASEEMMAFSPFHPSSFIAHPFTPFFVARVIKCWSLRED
ncbi:protein phosphatase 1, regulatory (inhibitor) subunit 14Bb isoform X1 [Phyllopteryx taeniolatus]|uniref:protein phosphatase 1, regulatory (inhibitor) subunit 14Bb isoform X1 n=1 Tax=Phyllopteryx taeniolatus TaxID=161469 RepID=UPI002AD36DC3|nr:protein phosphatase 1, regulatory (inhibitor) subunit 14Bb isoform X1 [Phyllopteryx taeniolatus]